MDVGQVPNKLFSHHRLFSRAEMDVEQVPDKLFSHHRILPRPKMDVGKMPNKLSAHHRIWLRPQMVGKFLPSRDSPKSEEPPNPNTHRANKCTLHLRQLGCQGDSPSDSPSDSRRQGDSLSNTEIRIIKEKK